MKRTMSRKSQIIYFLFLRFTGVEEMRDIRFPKDDLIPTINKLIETEPKHRVFLEFTICTPIETLITQCSFHEQERSSTRLGRQNAVEA